jgi:pimeloyl-ACP methyl ester carboxylesterase
MNDTSPSSISVKGYDIHYLDRGEGIPVVFVHGGVGDFRTWEGQMDAFSRNHRVIALSRRYAWPNEQIAGEANDYGVMPHAEDLAEFLTALELGPVHLVGHSYGGYTALLTALEHPDLVRSLTLGEPGVMSMLAYVADGAALGSEFGRDVLAPTAEAFANGDDQKAVEHFIAGVLDDEQFYVNASAEQRQVMMDNAFELKGICSTENPFPPLVADAVSQLQTPTLLIKGEKSPRLFIEIVNVLNRFLENSELATLADASHGLEYENPGEFNRIVLDFITRH